EICLLDDSDKAQRLEKVLQSSFGIYCVHFDQHASILWFGGKNGQLASMTLDDLSKSSRSEVQSNAVSVLSLQENSKILAIGSVRNCLVTIDSDRVIDLRRLQSEQDRFIAVEASKRLSAHESAVLGVCSLLHWHERGELDFLTYSARGTVLMWNFDGVCCGRIDIAIDQPQQQIDVDPNELKIVVVSGYERLLYAGDKMGILRVVDPSRPIPRQLQAHNGDINGIASAQLQDRILVASCGRDRTLQLFHHSSNELSLLQTLEEHAAAVTDLMFLDAGSMLISISSDRTVVVRKAAYQAHPSIAFLPIRVITLKTNPVSFAAVPSEPNIIIVSTTDRQIQRYDVSSGRLLHAFKALSPANNASVLVFSLQVITITHGGESLLVILAVSSADKSIRLHKYHDGSLLALEHGQSAVSLARMMQQKVGSIPAHVIVSCGHDGTILIYRVSVPSPGQPTTTPLERPTRVESPLDQNPTFCRPIRKTLTKSEVAHFQRVLQDSCGDDTSPMPTPSPSRVRKRTSRHSIVPSPRAQITGAVASTYMSGTGSSQRKSSQNHPPTSASPQTGFLAINSKSRPFLDHGQRSKSTEDIKDLDASAENICESLRIFRKRIILSPTGDKVSPAVMKELQRELTSTIDSISGNGRSMKVQEAGELLTQEHLAKMIDERLAISQRDEMTISKENKQWGAVSNDQIRAGAKAK
ncbi:MAG: hypothetical protein Q9164_001195, partial [Protoblastenia rupestris]